MIAELKARAARLDAEDKLAGFRELFTRLKASSISTAIRWACCRNPCRLGSRRSRSANGARA